MDAGQIKSIVEEFKQVITASSTRKKERAERTHTEDFDAEEKEFLEEENEQEEEVFDQVRSLCLRYFAFVWSFFSIVHSVVEVYHGILRSWSFKGGSMSLFRIM